MTFRRGSIVWVELGTGRGAEQGKRRPAVIVSNDGANIAAENLGYGVVIVVPMTSTVRHSRSFQVLIPRLLSGLGEDSIAQCEQLRAVDIKRLTATRYALSEDVMGDINAALMVQLGLHD